MPRESGPQFTSFETEHRKLAYENDFREMLRQNPEIIKATKNLVSQAEEEYAPENMTFGGMEFQWNNDEERWEIIKMLGEELDYPETYEYGRNAFLRPSKPLVDEKQNLELTMLGKTNRVLTSKSRGKWVDRTEYFRVKHGDEEYFIKKSESTINPGFSEFHNTHKAAQLLKRFDFVTVIESQLGYQKGKESWHVSKWKDIEAAGYNSVSYWRGLPFNDYGDPVVLPEGMRGQEVFADQVFRLNAIKEVLKTHGLHYDLYPNLFYNPETKHFILLDVTSPAASSDPSSPFESRDDIM